MANLIGWGVALLVIGLLVTFSNVFGFVAGTPIMWLGILLIAAGVILGIWHYATNSSRRMTGRGPIV